MKGACWEVLLRTVEPWDRHPEPVSSLALLLLPLLYVELVKNLAPARKDYVSLERKEEEQ